MDMLFLVSLGMNMTFYHVMLGNKNLTIVMVIVALVDYRQYEKQFNVYQLVDSDMVWGDSP